MQLEEHVLEHLIQQLGEGATLPSSTTLSEHLRSRSLGDVETEEGGAMLPCLDEWSVDEGDIAGDMCERDLVDIGLPEGITGQFPDTVRRRGPSLGTDSEGDEEDDASLPPQAPSRSLTVEEVTETNDRAKRQRVVPEEERYPILHGIRAKRQS